MAMDETVTTSVILDIRPGESVRLDGLVVVQLLRKSGHLSRLRITAPRSMTIRKQSEEQGGHVPSMADCQPS